MNEWDIPFDESMLEHDVIIHCPEEECAAELMEILERNSVKWGDGRVPTKRTNWGGYRNKTCYFIKSGVLSYRDLEYACRDKYDAYARCSFTGCTVKEIQDSSFGNILAL